MENYIVSARKYRPDTFQTVIGQPAITTTLKNAIRSSQLAHAYLFCGPRGVGKTTCARIFAKTINCFNLKENTEACNECESCKSFNSSRSFNIHELDAASNNSVEDIRNLIDQVRIPPQVAKYSIYIIDEVHMLSSQAFNAFLKTLEEPPAHAVFILATTEKHKILPTILSRCQIFDFNRIKIEDIASHLDTIAKAEKIVADHEGLNIIAQKADGAMRDALSIFDQIVSFSEGTVTYRNVIDNLNVLDYDYYFKLTEAALASDISSSLMTFNEVLERGFEGHNFINGLSRHFRDLLVCRDEITLQLLETGASIRDKYKMQSKECSQEFLVEALKITNQCDLSYRSSKNQRLHVELSLVQLCGLTKQEKKNSESYGSKLKSPSKSARTESESSPESLKTNPGKTGKIGPGNAGTITSDTDKLQNHDKDNAGIPRSAGIGKSHSAKSHSAKSHSAKSHSAKSPSGKSSNSSTSGNPDNPDNPDSTYSTDGTDSTPGAVNAGNTDNTDNGNIENIENNISNRINLSNENNTISIKDALRGNLPGPVAEAEKEIFEIDSEDDPAIVSEDSDDFTEKELMEQWKKFANQIRNRRPRLYNTMLANKPVINSQTSIEFEISNPLQEEALNKIKPELLSHLRNELNSNLELVITINETLRGSRLYLPEDKYEHMVRKNPDLAVFRQKFNLDFE